MPTIKARNVTAQMQFRGRGNPPAAHPQDAVGNFFPGLEFNFQNVWKRFFIGLEVLEHNAQVIAVDENEVAASGGDIVSQDADAVPLSSVAGGIFFAIDGRQAWRQMQGPLRDPNAGAPFILLEWSNMLAEVHAAKAGTDETVACLFQPPGEARVVGPFRLKVRRLLEPDTALIKRDTSLPGEITESLCSPWQTDYIGCACYYWASNRPDYVNITDPEFGGCQRSQLAERRAGEPGRREAAVYAQGPEFAEARGCDAGLGAQIPVRHQGQGCSRWIGLLTWSGAPWQSRSPRGRRAGRRLDLPFMSRISLICSSGRFASLRRRRGFAALVPGQRAR